MEICNLGTVHGESTQHRFTPYPSDTSAQQQLGFNLIDILQEICLKQYLKTMI